MVCIAPDEDAAGLTQLARDHGLTGKALMAVDPANVKNISLKNVMQVDILQSDGGHGRGDWSRILASFQAAEQAKPGKHRIAVSGLTDAKLIEAWWQAERGVAGVLKQIAAAAGKKSPVQEQAQLIVDAAKSALEARQAALTGSDFTTCEALERLAAQFDGLDLKAVKTRLTDLGKDAAIKKEQKARDAYRTCLKLLGSTKPKEQAQGKAGFAEVAKAFPDTVYGKRAAEQAGK